MRRWSRACYARGVTDRLADFDDEATARKDVDWYAAHGYEQIKVYSSMKPELVPAIIAEAHAKGLRVSGHVPAFMTASQVVKLGFDEVQHANMLLLNFMDTVKDTRTMARFTAVGAAGKDLDLTSPRVREFIALFKSHGVDIDPTLTTFEGMFSARPGTVDPNQAMIANRMPPIAVGKVADVVLVDGDPSVNISDVRKTVMVVKDGVRFNPKELYASVGVRP